MVVICFMVDLRSLAPSLLTDIKKSLLQLANLYAVSESSRDGEDRIGLCYLLSDTITYSNELKIAYSPRGTFRLCNFHQAVNSLPIGAFLPQMNYSGNIYNHGDLKLSTVLSDEVLYSWGGTDTVKKLIVLSSYIVGNTDSHIQKSLMDAGNRCVSVEFVFLEQESSRLRDMPDINSFIESICDLENCSFRTYFPDERVLAALVKRWLRELTDDIEEQTQARLIFKSSLLASVNHISCNLFKSVDQIIDRFCTFQTCRCHVVSSEDDAGNKFEGSMSFCPVPGHYSGTSNHSVKVEGETIHSLPSFRSCMKLQQDASPIDIFIIQRTKLGSLSEGVITGTPYIVSPLACQELEAASDGIDKSELNIQLFQGLCSALHSLDEGLVCFSNCNVETMVAAAFRCYYIVQPSERGPMLLRRLAASEEILLIPDVNQLGDSSVSKEIENSVLASLLQMESRAYNPLEHEMGFHHKLNLLVQESLQFGKSTSKDGLVPSDAKEATVQAKPVKEEKTHNILDMTSGEDRTSACIAKEWEQLIVDDEDPKTYSSTSTPTLTPRCIPKPKLEKSVVLPPDVRRVDVGTSKILERLEVPRQMKSMAVSPITSGRAMADVGMPQKNTIVPLQPMRPNFQRLKRKQQ